MLALSSPSGVQPSPTNYYHAVFHGVRAVKDWSSFSLNELNAILYYPRSTGGGIFLTKIYVGPEANGG